MESFNEESLNKLPVEYGDIAMSRGQARQIIDRFTQEAVKKNITPETFSLGLSYLREVGKSPDFTRSTIRNTLKSPMGKLMLENPSLVGQAADQFGGLVQGLHPAFGVNPALAGKHMGLVTQVMQEAKQDNLLRPNVTHEEIKREIQQPMYGALMDWTKTNMNNPAVQGVLSKTRFGAGNVSTWGPKGLIPLATGFEPNQFGLKLTPEAQKRIKEDEKQEAWYRSPQGQKQQQYYRSLGEKLLK
jgi:hypothetical protein